MYADTRMTPRLRLAGILAQCQVGKPEKRLRSILDLKNFMADEANQSAVQAVFPGVAKVLLSALPYARPVVLEALRVCWCYRSDRNTIFTTVLSGEAHGASDGGAAAAGGDSDDADEGGRIDGMLAVLKAIKGDNNAERKRSVLRAIAVWLTESPLNRALVGGLNDEALRILVEDLQDPRLLNVTLVIVAWLLKSNVADRLLSQTNLIDNMMLHHMVSDRLSGADEPIQKFLALSSLSKPMARQLSHNRQFMRALEMEISGCGGELVLNTSLRAIFKAMIPYIPNGKSYFVAWWLARLETWTLDSVVVLHQLVQQHEPARDRVIGNYLPRLLREYGQAVDGLHEGAVARTEEDDHYYQQLSQFLTTMIQHPVAQGFLVSNVDFLAALQKLVDDTVVQIFDEDDEPISMMAPASSDDDTGDSIEGDSDDERPDLEAIREKARVAEARAEANRRDRIIWTSHLLVAMPILHEVAATPAGCDALARQGDLVENAVILLAITQDQSLRESLAGLLEKVFGTAIVESLDVEESLDAEDGEEYSLGFGVIKMRLLQLRDMDEPGVRSDLAAHVLLQWPFSVKSVREVMMGVPGPFSAAAGAAVGAAAGITATAGATAGVEVGLDV